MMIQKKAPEHTKVEFIFPRRRRRQKKNEVNCNAFSNISNNCIIKEEEEKKSKNESRCHLENSLVLIFF